MKAFEGVFQTPFHGRATRPRETGYTMVIDKGLGLAATRDLMDTAADYIDSLKQTFGTSAFFNDRLMRDKVEIVKAAGVTVYPGGTFLEIAVWQNAVPAVPEARQRAGLYRGRDLRRHHRDVRCAAGRRDQAIVDMGLKVVTEVGKKDPSDKVALPKMHEEIRSDLEMGAFKVIVEARESGKGVGIFDSAGNPDASEVEAIIAGVDDPNTLVWEAPMKNQHVWLDQEVRHQREPRERPAGGDPGAGGPAQRYARRHSEDGLPG